MKNKNFNYEKEIKRLEELLYKVCEYIYELWKHDDLNYTHAKICFGMTKKEYNKYIKGE